MKDYQQKTRSEKDLFLLRTLLDRKAHLGHTSYRTDMAPFLLGVRDTTAIFDGEMTLRYLKRALLFLHGAKKAGCRFLFVSTDSRFSHIVKAAATSTGQPYVDKMWVGGTLTNRREAIKSFQGYRHFQQKFSFLLHDPDFEYLPYERANVRFRGFEQPLVHGVGTRSNLASGIAKQNHELSSSTLGGQESIVQYKEDDLLHIPDVIILLNPNENSHLLQEAALCNIPVVSIVDSDSDPSWSTYPIPANDDSMEFIHYFLHLVTKIFTKK